MVPEMNNEKVSVPNIKVCDNCSVAEGTDDASKRSVCSRYRMTIYCSKECHRAHRIAGHKQHGVANPDRALQQRSKTAEKGRIVVQTTLLKGIFIVKEVWNIIHNFLEVVWSFWMRAD